ncbi:MAG: glutamate--cysteine ligase [Rhodospirillales bacterium]
MSAPPSQKGAPIEDRRQLVEYVASGSKPASEWRIGTEHEKFAYRKSDLRPLPYDGPDGIRAMLLGMTRFGWQPVEEGGHVIALTKDRCNITLEPGGQFELSGAPLISLHDTCNEVNEHLDQVKAVGRELGVAMMGMGFNPKWTRDDIPWMPKGRYKIMRESMPQQGTMGLDLMLRTCTGQVNLDYGSEDDMIKKFRVSLALQPIATALFANSPFIDGKPNGLLSYRSHVWTDTDTDRCGDIPFVFDIGFTFERYVDWLLDVPMYFVYRDGTYIDASGQSFRDFLDGRLPALPGEKPLMTDWVDHMTTVFPEVRLKRFLEMRGADGGRWRRLCALPALWTGLLYDVSALDAAWDLVRDWTNEERAILRRDVPRQGLQTVFRRREVKDIAQEVLTIARAGLKSRAKRDTWGDDEAHFLDTLFAIAETGESPAHELLELYHGRWGGSVDPAFEELAY